MSNYRRAYVSGGTWFFTVNLLQRHQNNLLIRNIEPGSPTSAIKLNSIANPIAFDSDNEV